MSDIYHLVSRSAWEAQPGDYRADSLATEGFIHCSFAHQVEASARRHHAHTPDLLVLRIDPARLGSPVKSEPAKSGESFPHVHGAIERSAVIEVSTLEAFRRSQAEAKS